MGNYMSKFNCDCIFHMEEKKKTDKLDNNQLIVNRDDITGLVDINSFVDSYCKNDNSYYNLKKCIKLPKICKISSLLTKLASFQMKDSVILEDSEISDKVIVSNYLDYHYPLSSANNVPDNFNEEVVQQIQNVNENKKVQTHRSGNSLFTRLYTTSVRSFEKENAKKGKYIGTKINNKKEGIGKVIWKSGSKFIGSFVNNRTNGIGIFTDCNGAKFIGEYNNNRPCGWGYYSHSNGARYEGEWNGRRQENIGLEIWPDSTIYHGLYEHGKKHGIGIHKWPDGSSYEGEWHNNIMTGYDERIYMGQFSNGMMNGYGEFYWPDGKKYIGYYLDDLKEGFGIFYWSLYPLKIYVGTWQNGVQHGLGMTVTDKTTSYGYWNKGRKEISFKGLWEMKIYSKENKLKYFKIFEKNLKDLLDFCKSK